MKQKALFWNDLQTSETYLGHIPQKRIVLVAAKIQTWEQKSSFRDHWDDIHLCYIWAEKKKKDVLYLIALDLPKSYAVLGQQKKKYREN